ncbi:MAG: glycosyltransferase family 4 protein [Planctomycetota bacterium]|nr:glycosyltransferase family 4 protein [Planctomycetota bacterium]
MKIGVWVSVIAGQKGFERNVSGHIQVPLFSIQKLIEEGHEVHLITNAYSDERSVPFCMPDGVKVHFVIDARNRGGVLERTGHQRESINFFKLLKQVNSIKHICHSEKFDALHMFGYNRTAQLASGMKLLGLNTPVVVTMFAANLPKKLSFIAKFLWSKIDAVVTATGFVKKQLEARGLAVSQVRHGVIRDIASEYDGTPVEPKHRVLFWRDLTVKNGADVALSAFTALAEKYPDVQFDFAVRQHWNEIKDVEDQIAAFDNVSLYRFPYSEGKSISKFLLESLCVIMPIRDISIDPQLVIAESLSMGVPVIATDQRSNPEFVIDDETGKLIPLDDNQRAIDALDALLSNREQTLKMGDDAKAFIEKNWNWMNYVNEIVDVYRHVSKR